MNNKKLRKRTISRELSLKALFAKDISDGSPKELFERVCSIEPIKDDQIRDFAFFLIEGVSSNLKELDRIISSIATNWHLDRMANTDRNIIRIAVFELIHTKKVPPKAVINEAIEMAKKYGDPESGKFVNGILDRIKTEYVDKLIVKDQ